MLLRPEIYTTNKFYEILFGKVLTPCSSYHRKVFIDEFPFLSIENLNMWTYNMTIIFELDAVTDVFFYIPKEYAGSLQPMHLFRAYAHGRGMNVHIREWSCMFR